MGRIIRFFVVALVICFTASLAFAGWDSCKGCHTDSGKPGPSKASMLKKFKSADELVKAAMASTNPMMQGMKNETVLKAAAKEMGFKDSKTSKKDASKEAVKEDVKRDAKADDKTNKVDQKKADKKETPKETPSKVESTKKEEPKKKKAIEGC